MASGLLLALVLLAFLPTYTEGIYALVDQQDCPPLTSSEAG